MVALEVFFLKLKLCIHTGIAGGLFTLKATKSMTRADARVMFIIKSFVCKTSPIPLLPP
jgi:hypothetical protein